MSFLSDKVLHRRRILFGSVALAGFSACRLKSAESGNSTDDTASLETAIENSRGKRLIIARGYRVAAGKRYFSDTIPDPHSAALTIKSGMILDGNGSGLISCSTPDKSVIEVYNGMTPVSGVQIKNVHLSQLDSSILGDGKNHGLTDDYFALRFNGASYCDAENIIIETCSLGVTFQFNQYAMPRRDPLLRASHNNKSRKITIKRCTYMGLQLGGEAEGTHTEYTIVGKSRFGRGRASTHGIRLIGYNNMASEKSVNAICQNNKVTGHVIRGFANALSIQQWVRNNLVSLTSRDCRFGINITRQPEKSPYGNPSDATAQQNDISIDHNGGDYGIHNDGGSNNRFTVAISDTTLRGIYEAPSRSTPGLSNGNAYRGTIVRPGKRGADLGGNDTTVDLDITGSGIETTDFGCVVSGIGAHGHLAVRNCKTGVQLTGTKAVLSVKVDRCTNAVVITGDGNTLDCDIDGNVIIAGNHNRISGRVRGHVSEVSHAVGNDVRTSAS